MSSLFNYNTLKVSLIPQTKTLEVTLNQPESDNAITPEMIFELETLFSWTASHIEINSILLNSSTEFFSRGLDNRELEKMTDEKLQKLLERTQKLVYAMFFMPQTIICDLGMGASGLALELSIGADIRLLKENGTLKFDQLKKGFVSCSGGVGFLSAIVGASFARKWNLSGLPLSKNEMLLSGFISEIYDSEDTVYNYLKSINVQAPIARIQMKRSLLDPILPALDAARTFEKEYAIAGMCMGDWRKALWAERDDQVVEFNSAKALAAQLKKEREASLNN